jgi:exodeoxyribonuclease VII large subunit
MKLDPRRLTDRVNQNLMHLDNLTGRSDRSITSVIKEKSMQLEAADGILGGLDPNRVLDRGYTMIRNADGEVITSVKGLSVGEKITIKMKDGEAAADITEVR